ncbi:unnamed protein product [Larinioides sclopetarius]|uniref:Uncharacterized protein n=1 Tax=Larinioides sclopetarius TaxID=280406 RepID=A0AAV1ZBQ1_9ARAC
MVNSKVSVVETFSKLTVFPSAVFKHQLKISDNLKELSTRRLISPTLTENSSEHILSCLEWLSIYPLLESSSFKAAVFSWLQNSISLPDLGNVRTSGAITNS